MAFPTLHSIFFSTGAAIFRNSTISSGISLWPERHFCKVPSLSTWFTNYFVAGHLKDYVRSLSDSHLEHLHLCPDFVSRFFCLSAVLKHFFCFLFGSIFISCTVTSLCQSALALPAADSNLTGNLIGLIHCHFNLSAANVHIYVHCRLSSLFNLIAYLCLHFRIHLMATSRVAWRHIVQ